MATKKQKHEAAVARREAYLAEQREIGQRAIEAAARKREIENREAWLKGHEKHYKFIDECPHCTDIKKAQSEKARLAAIDKVVKASAAALAKARKEDENIDLTRQENIDKALASAPKLSPEFGQVEPDEFVEPPSFDDVPKAEIEGVDLYSPFAQKASAG